MLLGLEGNRSDVEEREKIVRHPLTGPWVRGYHVRYMLHNACCVTVGGVGLYQPSLLLYTDLWDDILNLSLPKEKEVNACLRIQYEFS